MFYYFFLQYKDEIYFSNRKKLKIKDIILLTVLLISCITFSIYAMLQVLNVITFISLVVFISDIIYMSLYVRKIERTSLSEKVQNYKETKISPLIELLKADTYNLYTLEGINLLIECCIVEPKKLEFKISFQNIVLPFITLAYAGIINNLSLSEIMPISITFIALLLLVIMSGMAVQPIIDYITNPDKTKYAQLKSELEYIRSQL